MPSLAHSVSQSGPSIMSCQDVLVTWLLVSLEYVLRRKEKGTGSFVLISLSLLPYFISNECLSPLYWALCCSDVGKADICDISISNGQGFARCPSCSTSYATPCKQLGKSNRIWPRCLGSRTDMGDPEIAPLCGCGLPHFCPLQTLRE